MTTLTIISRQEFEDVYGNLVALDLDDEKAGQYQTEHRLWTEFDDGHLESGKHFVNRLRYIVSKTPFDPTMLIVVDSHEINWKDFDEDAKERRINYMAKKRVDKPTSDLKWEAEAGIGWGMDDMLERARKNADDDIAWGEDLEYFEVAYAAIQVMAKRLEAAEATVKELKDKADRLDSATVIVAIDPDDMKTYVGLNDISHIDAADYRAIEDKIAEALYSYSPMSFDEIAKLIIEDNFPDVLDRAHYYFIAQGKQTAYVYEAEHTLSPQVVGETIYVESLEGAKLMAQHLSKTNDDIPVEIHEDNTDELVGVVANT